MKFLLNVNAARGNVVKSVSKKIRRLLMRSFLALGETDPKILRALSKNKMLTESNQSIQFLTAII